MDPTLDLPPLDVVSLMQMHQLRPKKSLGQNFLVDPVALRRIIHAAELPDEATVLEIGPGFGSLTRYLAVTVRRVIAVELDSALVPVLRQTLSTWSNVTVIQGDILLLDPANLILEPGYMVVANIPYYITSALIRHLLEARLKPARLVLTVQREVAERICADPGDMSLLALSVQVYGLPQVIAHIPAGAFYPPPKVDSSVVRVDLLAQPRIPAERLDDFFTLAKAGFNQKRKMLRNALSRGLNWSPAQVESLLQNAKIDSHRRAETLSLEEWGRMTEVFSGFR